MSTLSFWTCLAFLFAPMLLLARHAWGGWLYAVSAIVAMLYHESGETEWKHIDHALAYATVGANAYLAWSARGRTVTFVGIGLLVPALAFYFAAHRGDYDRRHALWHVLAGAANACFALGYAW